jgi:hypothetical protein
MKTVLYLFLIIITGLSSFSADIDISSMEDVDSVFSKYVDSLYSYYYFMDKYTTIPNALDVYLFLSPLDTYYLSPDITSSSDPLDTSLFNFSFYYQLTPFEYLTLFSYLDGILFAHEFNTIVDGYARANLILGARGNTDYFTITYGIIHELEFTEITYPVYEGAYMLVYAMGYLTALSPISIIADIFETGISLDMLKLDLNFANIFTLLNRNTLFNSTLVAIKAFEKELFGLDMLLQYAWLSEHYISGGCAVTFGDENFAIRVVPILDMRQIIDELQVFIITPFFEVHTECDVEDWESLPRFGIAGEVRPYPLFSAGFSINDSYFTPFQSTRAFMLYGRFHFDSTMENF